MQVFYSLIDNNQSLKLRAKDREIPVEALHRWFDREYIPYFQQPFVVDHGKRVCDIIGYYSCGLFFISENLRRVIAVFVEDIDKYLLPIQIEGLDSTYYAFHDLPAVGECVNHWKSVMNSEEETCFVPYSEQMHLFTINRSRLIMMSPALKNAIAKAKLKNIYFYTYYGACDYDEYEANRSFLREESKKYALAHGLGYSVFRQATTDDIPVIMQIISDAVDNMHAKGRTQWSKSYPTLHHIQEDIENGEAYVMEDFDEIVAYMAVSFRGEMAYKHIQGKWLSNGKYAVVHRLVVKVSKQNHGTASFMLTEAEHLAEERSVASIRLDTSEDNIEMLRSLQHHRRGFDSQYEYCGKVYYFRNLRFHPRLAFELIRSIES